MRAIWVLRATIDERTRVFRLPPGLERTLGRGASADFIVGDPRVSRIHCRLTASREQLRIEDLKSTNGTFRNDERIDVAFLEDGDRVRVGQVELSVSLEEPRAVEVTG